MRKKIILGTILTLSLVFIVSAFAPVFAITTNEESLNAAGQSVIDVPGQTTIFLLAQHFERSDFYRGSAERISLYVGGKPVAAYEDNPTRFAFSQEVGKGGPVSLNLVGRCQIQVFRICKTVFVLWKIPLVMPATETTPAVTLPPGILVLQGEGDVRSDKANLNFPLSGWNGIYETTGYNAKATLFCPRWHYWGPVAEAPNPSPRIATEGTLTWTHP